MGCLLPASFLPLTLPLFLFIQSNASGFQPRNIQSSQNIRSVGRLLPLSFILWLRVEWGEGGSVHNAYCAREAMNYGHTLHLGDDRWLGCVAIGGRSLHERRTDGQACKGPLPQVSLTVICGRPWMERFCAEQGHLGRFFPHSPTTFLLVLPAFLKRIHPKSWYRPRLEHGMESGEREGGRR